MPRPLFTNHFREAGCYFVCFSQTKQAFFKDNNNSELEEIYHWETPQGTGHWQGAWTAFRREARDSWQWKQRSEVINMKYFYRIPFFGLDPFFIKKPKYTKVSCQGKIRCGQEESKNACASGIWLFLLKIATKNYKKRKNWLLGRKEISSTLKKEMLLTVGGDHLFCTIQTNRCQGSL